MSALRLINETTASSVASVSVTDIFTSDFDIYKIVIDDYQSATSQELAMRFVNSSGSVVSASNYDRATLFLRSYNTFQEGRATSADKIEALGFNSATTVGFGLTLYVINPNLSSSYSFVLSQTSSDVSGSGNINYKAIGVLKQTASMGGLNFFGASGHNLTSINIRTYGLRVDNG